MKSAPPAAARRWVAWRASKRSKRGWASELAVEEPLEIRIRGKVFGVTMRTPGHDTELVAGFLLAEGLLRKRSDWISLAPCRAEGVEGVVVNAFLSAKVRLDWKTMGRGFLTSSSCGFCGSKMIENVRRRYAALVVERGVDLDLLAELPGRMVAKQTLFKKTGGVHAAALFDRQGRLLVVREDVGRHNAVDKVVGHAFLDGRIPLTDCALAVSGRVSFEIAQKALAAGISAVVAVSAPTTLAVSLAREAGLILAGFARGGAMTLYAGPRANESGGAVVNPAPAAR